jgi:hypothetical protein
MTIKNQIILKKDSILQQNIQYNYMEDIDINICLLSGNVILIYNIDNIGNILNINDFVTNINKINEYKNIYYDIVYKDTVIYRDNKINIDINDTNIFIIIHDMDIFNRILIFVKEYVLKFLDYHKNNSYIFSYFDFINLKRIYDDDEEIKNKIKKINNY